MKVEGHIATASTIAGEDFAGGDSVARHFLFDDRQSELQVGSRLRSPAVIGFFAVRSHRNAFVRFVIFSLLTFASCLPVRAQSAPSEYDVKAAYLYNFGKFVKWPSSATKGPNFLICVIGEDPFHGALAATVNGERVNGKAAAVIHLESTHNASDCNILFISRSERYHVRRMLESFDTAGTLTVSDIPGFTDDGGIIEFINQSGRIRFDINLAAAQQAGLNLSSELLKVASAVKGKR